MAKKILIIDDEESITKVFDTALSHGGFEVTTAKDGKSGVEAASKDTFDLILCDQMMPDMTGNAVLKALKENEKTKGVKVAILTNYSQDNMVEEALSNGAIDYILKYQISPDDLVNKAKSLVGE